MKVILDEMLAALSRGERVVLCSILASSGSVPRGAGAKMAVLEDGRVLGTIGGGAVERLSIERARRALNDGGSNELEATDKLGMRPLQAGWYLAETGTLEAKRQANFPLLQTPFDVLDYLD